jgi:pimeloyl-ACP methyl ester carboxylesterase
MMVAVASVLSLPALPEHPALGRTIAVPIDRQDPRAGTAPLYFEFGAPYDASKPTVLVVADGQQYFVRKGTAAGFQKDLFGDAFNVVALVPRGATPEFIKAAVGADGRPDWLKAWRVFNSDEWVEDIDAVRKAVAGEGGKVLLYGKSGGAYLVQQYLARHGDRVRRAFVESPANPFINRELGIAFDTFWRELGSQDRGLQAELRKALERNPGDRTRILIALQRQHFYVPADKLADARARLIRALAAGDTRPLEACRKDYEVDAVLELSASADVIPQNVRVIELIRPSGEFGRLGGEAVRPLIETQYGFTRPLNDLVDAGKIPEPAFDFAACHRLDTEVFLLGSRWDEAVDYRSTIALAYTYPRHQLFIADDNHTLKKLTAGPARNDLLRAFLALGPGSAEFRDALAAAEPYRWAVR